MNTKRIATAALFATALASVAVTPASAQPCYYTRDWFPLVFPFSVAAAAVETAAAIVSLPLAALSFPPYTPSYLYSGACGAPYLGYPPPPPYNPALANQYAPPPGYYGYYGPR
ncbi:MAG TPA: hypothetical protein VHU15_09445 [Stellaceae bacterium]|jgi:hypothetical protein|nr:hypothetical protein [Stellaceae bacterium]